MYRAGIDLGGTNIKAGIIDEQQHIIAEASVPTNVERPYQDIIRDMAELVKTLLKQKGIGETQLKSIGIGSPGTIDAVHGVVLYSNNFGWENVPLTEQLKKYFSCPIAVSNDANCAALGEVKAGAAQNTKNAILLTLGTGVGGGIILDGKVFEGAHAGGAELGHTSLICGGEPCTCGRKGCVEAYVSATALIGNYGITPDMESARPWPDGYIVRELSRMPSNFRCQGSIQDFLTKHDIPGIAGIDTRALTKILREKGTMNGMITTNENYNLDEILPKLKEYTTGNVVDKVTCSEKNVLKGSGKKVALMDFGAKNNIAKSLNARGCEVTIYPAHTSAEEILGANPDGIMLSNGPGDPKECTAIIEELKKLYASDVPIFAICLGHQLMALANGADTHKMKYGHRGGNHPVKDLSTGRVYISSQNHGYVVDTDTLDPKVAKPAFVNVNDGTNEGLEYVGKNIFTVQFHPEACPGPQDSSYLFDRFIQMMGGNQ